MSRQATAPIVVGGEPRVSLLPPEIHERQRIKQLRRKLLAFIVLAIVLVVAGYAGATYLSILGQQALTAENEKTTTILAEQSKYSAVQTTSNRLTLAKQAQLVGSSTEIDLAAYLELVQATLPAGTSIGTVAVDAATPIASYPQATVPLQPSRIATLTFTAETSSLPDVPSWLRALETLPGFADATPGSIKLTDSGRFQAQITMHIGVEALTGRFAEEESK